MKIKPLPEIDNLCELVGEFIEYWGFKKIHGKIWVHVFMSEKPLDAKDLIRLLSISKALVSITIKDLLEYEVILESNLSAEGTRTYVANQDIGYVIQRVLRKREKVMMGKIKSSLDNLKNISHQDMTENNINPERIKDVGKLVNKGDKMLSTVMAIIK